MVPTGRRSKAVGQTPSVASPKETLLEEDGLTRQPETPRGGGNTPFGTTPPAQGGEFTLRDRVRRTQRPVFLHWNRPDLLPTVELEPKLVPRLYW